MIHLVGEIQTFEAPVSSNGEFEFPKAPFGLYSLTTNPYERISRSVIVDDDDSGPIDFRVPAIRQIRGRVVVEDGSPLPRAKFKASVPGLGKRAETEIGPDGTFMLTLSDDEHDVELVAYPAPYRVKSIRYGSVDLLQRKLRVTADNVEEILVTLTVTQPVPWVKVAGHVTGAEKLPASTKVVLDGGIAPLFMETRIDTNGDFVFLRVPPDTYSLRTEPPVYRMPSRTLVIEERDISEADLVVPEQRFLTFRVRVEGRGTRPNIAFNLKQSDGKGFRFIFPAALISPLMIGRTDTECISDACSTAPAGRFLNEPVTVPEASSPDSFTLKLPDGEYRMQMESIPAGYVMRALSYGSRNLLEESFSLNGKDIQEIVITLRSPVN